jgi:hypothetical protein
MSRWSRWTVAALLVASACSTFSSSSDDAPTGGPDAGGDGTTPPPNPNSTDAADAATPDGHVLTDGDVPVPNGDFEQSTGTSCAPGWEPLFGTESASTIARNGKHGCMVCNTQSTAYFTAKVSIPTAPVTGQYVVSAWGHDVPDGGSNGAVVFVALYVTSDGGDPVLHPNTTDLTPDTWVQAQASTNANAGDLLDVAVGGEGPPGDCLVIDDVLLEVYPQ